MNHRAVLSVIGGLLVLLAAILVVPLAIAVAEYVLPGWFAYPRDYLPGPDELLGEIRAFQVAILLTLGAGGALTYCFRAGRDVPLGNREGFAVVSLGWVACALFGALPFLLSGMLSSPVDAVFETMSGFTTTGATVLTEIAAQPKGLLFWRSLTHWIGGMGIIVLSLAILPALGVGGYLLFKAEVPGPTGERLRPRIAQTAKILWGVYVAISLAEVLLLWLFGMNLFDSCCHTFGTMATGGFSTQNESIGFYPRPAIHYVIVIFMFLAGCNFVLHYQWLRGRFGPVWRNQELRWFVCILLAATVVVTLSLWLGDPAGFNPGPREMADYGLADAFRHGLFQVVSITTTTGYCTENFDAWPNLCRMLLLLLMFVGGCAGSTGGAIKIARVLVLFKAGWRELRLLVKPRTVIPLRIGGEPVEPDVVRNILAFFVLYVGLTAFAILLLCLLTSADLLTNISAVVACIGNIGPGLAGVGARENYAHLPALAKVVLTLCMLLGRLELYGVLVLLTASAWKK